MQVIPKHINKNVPNQSSVSFFIYTHPRIRRNNFLPSNIHTHIQNNRYRLNNNRKYARNNLLLFRRYNPSIYTVQPLEHMAQKYIFLDAMSFYPYSTGTVFRMDDSWFGVVNRSHQSF